MQIFVVFLSLCFLLSQVADGQALDTTKPQPISQLELKLREVRFDLRLDNQKLSGDAVPLLKDAIGDAQYVLIGEDHITREIPLFTEAVCDLMAPQGLTEMAVEAGREAAEFVSSTIDKQDRIERMAMLLKQNPDSVSFLNIRQENDLAALLRCSRARARFSYLGARPGISGFSGVAVGSDPGHSSRRSSRGGVDKVEERRATGGRARQGIWRCHRSSSCNRIHILIYALMETDPLPTIEIGKC